jgi:hypothetical protein
VARVRPVAGDIEPALRRGAGPPAL